MAYQFAINLKRSFNIAGERERTRLKKGSDGGGDGPAKEQAWATARKGDPINARKNTDVENAVP